MTTTWRTVAQDHPHLVNVALAGFVVAHAVTAHFASALDVSNYFEQVTGAELASAFATVAGLATILAGFSGVVVVFGLQSDNDRFRRMRVSGGRALRTIWVATVATALAAAFIAAAGSIASLLVAPWAPWLLELALLLCAHAALRQLWLLHHLARVVGASDTETDRANAVIPLDRLRRPRPGA